MLTIRSVVAAGLGLTVLCAGYAHASERTRTGNRGGAAREGVTEGAAPGLMESGDRGDTSWERADGSLTALELAAAIYRDMPVMELEDGTLVYADGTFVDSLRFDAPQPAVAERGTEQLKAEMPWMEVTVEGHTMVTFADGSVPGDASAGLPAWLWHRMTMPHIRVGGERIYADGTVFPDEPAYR